MILRLSCVDDNKFFDDVLYMWLVYIMTYREKCVLYKIVESRNDNKQKYIRAFRNIIEWNEYIDKFKRININQEVHKCLRNVLSMTNKIVARGKK